MEKISIASKDKRFIYVKDMLVKSGYGCEICEPYSPCNGDILLLSPKAELREDEIEAFFLNGKNIRAVFTGQSKIIKKYFDGAIIDYSDDEAFLLENAYITAQCAIRRTLEDIDSVIYGKNALVIGYGRIGKYLASMLKSLGAVVFVLARREESLKDAELSGMKPCVISDIDPKSLDLVYNTVPYKIISKDISDIFSKDSLIMELASGNGGFEDENVAVKALGLPGKYMPKSAGKAIYDLVHRFLSQHSERRNI